MSRRVGVLLLLALAVAITFVAAEAERDESAAITELESDVDASDKFDAAAESAEGESESVSPSRRRRGGKRKGRGGRARPRGSGRRALRAARSGGGAAKPKKESTAIAPASAARNMSPKVVNPSHAGQLGGHADHTRLGIGKQISIKQTNIYDSKGRVMGVVKPQLIGGKENNGINAGAIQTVAGQLCVLGFRLSGVTGWVPVSALNEPKLITKHTREVKNRINSKRPKSSGPMTVTTVTNAGLGKFENLYVFPHQTGVENKAKYYFVNKNGVVNLLLNVPKPGSGGLFGSALDVISPGTQFHRYQNIKAIRIPVYPKGSVKPVADTHLVFVYGYAVNGAGEKVHGWLNMAVLK